MNYLSIHNNLDVLETGGQKILQKFYKKNNCLFSIDVEDWFHILDVPSAPAVLDWANMPSRVEKNFHALLNIMDKYSVKATCFFLGWIAERFRHLVEEAHNRGHEIASHGYYHELAFRMNQEDFLTEAMKSKDLLEQIIGNEVKGYRASGFSYTETTNWLPSILARAGYKYDSSLFPATRGHGGLKGGQKSPFVIKTSFGDITEVPISVASIMGKEICFFGGGYFRLFPYRLIHMMAEQVLSEKRPVLFYLHPREIDPEQPRLKMSLYREFKSYYNISATEEKLDRIFAQFNFCRIDDYLCQNDLMVQ